MVVGNVQTHMAVFQKIYLYCVLNGKNYEKMIILKKFRYDLISIRYIYLK